MLDLLRVLLLGAAGALLFFLVRQALGDDPRMRLVVLAGFLGRAFLSQLLFWISYLSLPVASGLQLKGGLWFFAVDSKIYIDGARLAAAGGPDDIVRLTATNPSASYIQVLSLFTFLFGEPVAVSLLLNLFCYAGACAIITRWSATSPQSRTAALIALAAISLSPSGVLWSMQPLKDTFFQFLIVAFFGACFLWQRAWRADDLRRQAWWAGAAIIAVHFLISGVRWYIGFMMLVVIVPILPVLALTMRRRRLLGALASLVVLVLLSRSYLLAAGPYLPPPVSNLLHLRSPYSNGARPIVAHMDEVRSGFERTGGSTAIRPVTSKRPAEPLPQIASRNAESPATPTTVRPTPGRTSGPQPEPRPSRKEPKRTRGTTAPSTATVAEAHPPASHTGTAATTAAETALKPAPSGETPAAAAKTAETRVAEGPPKPATPRPSAGARPKAPADAGDPVAAKVLPAKVAETKPHPPAHPKPDPPRTEPGAGERAAAQPAETKIAEGASKPPAPSRPEPREPAGSGTPPSQTKTKPVAQAKKTAAPKPVDTALKPSPEPGPAPDARAAAPAVLKTAASAPRPVPPPAPAPEGPPPTHAQKLLAGAAAAALPQAVSTRFGLVQIGEGRGFAWFTELDTLLFDALLLIALASIVLRFRSASYRNGVFWLILAVTILMGGALAYTVTNFGTLFRHRVMITTGLALIPLALATAPTRQTAAPARESA
jgi:hypothetical protein